MLSVNSIMKCHFASVITTAENGDMYDYRLLLNNVATLYMTNSVCCSSETTLFSRVHIDVFLELLSCGCCVDIQQNEVCNIVSNAARLYETDITLLL